MDTAPRPASTPSIPLPRTPWVAQGGSSGRLPISLTSFVGRDDEIALATSLLRQPDLRLLALTGPGGIGKTRLAIEVAAASHALSPDGVPFVSLASIQDPSLVLPAIAAALGLQELDASGIEGKLATFLERPTFCSS